jgi:hypothetical protein
MRKRAHRQRAIAYPNQRHGVRKLRWGRGNIGKSGGVRVIYYFHSDAMPLYLLTMFGKGERAQYQQSGAQRTARTGETHC